MGSTRGEPKLNIFFAICGFGLNVKG